MHGGERIADVLVEHGVGALTTLCGGHISPILVATKRRGIRVVDVRHEATAVFAADAVARLTGRPGVAAVTAGPGATNTITALKNAQLAQSPVVLLVGAPPTILRGRGALQDIDQRALFRAHSKSVTPVDRVADLAPAVERAFATAQRGIPGPAVVECPVDLLYDEATVRSWYEQAAAGRSVGARAQRWYLVRHANRLFSGPTELVPRSGRPVVGGPSLGDVRRALRLLARASRPVLLVGSQATLDAGDIGALAGAIEALGVPVFLSGMARGVLGRRHPLQLRHHRRAALREADLVVLAGVPCDFRLDYGRHISRRAAVVAANRSVRDLHLNRRPTVGSASDPAQFLRRLAAKRRTPSAGWSSWLETLRERDRAREDEISTMASAPTEYINPIALNEALERSIGDEAVIVADGGDFVATASYVIRPRGPLSWLDPGVFGTLGAGAGFALGAALARPGAEVWILYGDGSAAFSLMEFDTFARHGIPVVAVIGNDGGWTQIAREQEALLGDPVGTVLARTAYERVANGCGGVGFSVDRFDDVPHVLEEARAVASSGRPVLVNAMIGRTEFRKGAVSI